MEMVKPSAMWDEESIEEEVQNLISYAVKEGYIDDSAVDWTAEEKRAYYNKSDSLS